MRRKLAEQTPSPPPHITHDEGGYGMLDAKIQRHPKNIGAGHGEISPKWGNADRPTSATISNAGRGRGHGTLSYRVMHKHDGEMQGMDKNDALGCPTSARKGRGILIYPKGATPLLNRKYGRVRGICGKDRGNMGHGRNGAGDIS